MSNLRKLVQTDSSSSSIERVGLVYTLCRSQCTGQSIRLIMFAKRRARDVPITYTLMLVTHICTMFLNLSQDIMLYMSGPETQQVYVQLTPAFEAVHMYKRLCSPFSALTDVRFE